MKTKENSVNSWEKKTSMRVTPNPVTIEDNTVFSNWRFEVPIYQREYSWELEQVSDLLYDIDNSSLENPESPLFLGSLLLAVKPDNSVYEIIDGQQRLSTIFLILFSLKQILDSYESTTQQDKDLVRNALKIIEDIIYKRAKKTTSIDGSTEPRLSTGKRDRILFKKLMRGELIEPTKDKTKKSHRLLTDAFDFLHDKLKNKLKTYGLIGVLSFLDKVKSCEYIVMTAEEKKDEILLFKTLNSRGLDLSESDLIKYEVCSKPKGLTDDESVILWDEMRDILEKAKVNIEVFLFHYINSRDFAKELRKKIDSYRGEQKNLKDETPPIPEKLLYVAFERYIRDMESTLNFLEDLKSTAIKYLDICSPDENETYLLSLRTLNITKCYPLLLRGKDVLNDKNFNRLAKAVECISFRHSVLKNDPKDLEKLYYSLMVKLNSDNDIQNIVELIKQHPSMVDEKRFKLQFEVAEPKKNVSKMILSRIIKESSTKAISWIKKDVNLEHIMPQTPKGEWLKIKQEEPELYDMSLNRLGNLTLIQGKLNSQIGNNNFDVKKNGFKESRFNINTYIIEQEKWTPDEIDKRQTALYELAKDIWTL